MISLSILGAAFLGLIVSGVLAAQDRHVNPAGAGVIGAMVATAGITGVWVVAVLVLLVRGSGVEAEWLPGAVLLGSGTLSVLLAAASVYWSKPGWTRRGLFVLSAVSVAGVGLLGFPFLLTPVVAMVIALLYLAMAIANPPLRPAEAT